MIKAIDFSKLNDSYPHKEFIIQDWLAIGSVSSFFGERETGKSLLVQELMTALQLVRSGQVQVYGQLKFMEYFQDTMKPNYCIVNMKLIKIVK